jgi:hypothetical protein
MAIYSSLGQKTYPALVSRTLDPNSKAIVTVVGRHDAQITDADINLIQDLQDLKRHRAFNDKSCTSGCLTYAPMQFNTGIANTFFVPGFDTLFNGEIVTVTGNLSSDLTLNRVIIPAPVPWAPGVTDEDSRIYVVFLELWYEALNPITGAGYYTSPTTGLRYFYPYGGVQPDSSNATIVPDDSVDPFQGLFTTERAQIQWRINIQRVATSYDFTKYQFGLDPGAIPQEIVYAQASNPAPITAAIYEFTNMGTVNGDTGLWRAGDGNVNNSLGTMDGYSYAMPIAVMWQKNTGNFDIVNNPFGCADPSVPGSGTLASDVSGRFDDKLADQIFNNHVVDTRITVTLDAWDFDKLTREGFSDLVIGNARYKIGRGLSPGGISLNSTPLGSALIYDISVSPTPINNTQTIGQWDGFSNGFSSDTRTFSTTISVSTNEKSVGVTGQAWLPQDAFTLLLPANSPATITSVDITALVNNTQNGTKFPAALLQGQVNITGLGSRAVTVTIAKDLRGTSFDPGPNNIYATIGVTYPGGSGFNLQHVPVSVDGGVLFDQTSGKTLPVFGISEYAVQTQQIALTTSNLVGGKPITVNAVWSINPEYSEALFGTKVWLAIPGNAGSQTTVAGQTSTTFVIPRMGINEHLNGLYVTKAWDSKTGAFYNIQAVTMTTGATQNHILTIGAAVPPTSTIIVSMLAQDTVQLAYNAPVKGATEIEETVLFGNFNGDKQYAMDTRVNVVSLSFDPVANVSTIVLDSNDCIIKGISGGYGGVDGNRIAWVSDGLGNLNGVQIQSITFSNGLVTVIVPNVALAGASAKQFMFVGSILPAFTSQSTLILQEHYVPYQGEGIVNRDYEILHSEDNALVTTNGTGRAPLAGLADVYPYNRELPISTTLPSQLSWNDATMVNEALASFFDSNYVAMRVNNVEHTFLVPLHTNDFIPPVNKDTRKEVRFLTPGGRGYATAIPHLGFAIAAPSPRTAIGQNVQTTVAPITLFVNNLSGSDSNDGLSLNTPKLTIPAALAALPPILRHPCDIQLVVTGQPYTLTQLIGSLEVVALGDGDIRATKIYCVANLSRDIQDEGRLVISTQAGSTGTVVIDATGFSGFGDGPTSAFYIDTSRVIINGLTFKGFTNPAITGYNADIDFVGCTWTDCLQAGAFTGCDTVILDRGQITLPNAGVGMVLTQSNLTSSSTVFAIDTGANPGPFFVGERQSTVNLQTHQPTTLLEVNISALNVIAQVELNSSIVVTQDFQTAGSAVLEANSVLARTVSANPFLGGVQADASSVTVTQF